MSTTESLLIILIAAIATATTRFLPFAIFSSNRGAPRILHYFGKALPPAVFGMLVVYCLKDVSLSSPGGFLPEIVALATVIVIHLAFRKMLLSVFVGTVAYMLLVNFVFV
jgi:branched-subunit amino acid transport protein AzlD